MAEFLHLDNLFSNCHRDFDLLDRVTHIIFEKEVLEDGERETLLHLHIDGSGSAEVLSISEEAHHLLSAPEIAESQSKVDSINDTVVEDSIRSHQMLVVNRLKIVDI